MVLQTLVKKYGYSREEFFINSKQGWVGYDSLSDAAPELQVEELVAGTDLTHEAFLGGKFYSIDPIYLEHSLQRSLAKM